MSKWDRLIEYLKTTSAKPDAVLASVKAMWPVKGKKEIKYTDSYIIRKTWAYVVCHKIYFFTYLHFFCLFIERPYFNE
jgi:hypothetical protein